MHTAAVTPRRQKRHDVRATRQGCRGNVAEHLRTGNTYVNGDFADLAKAVLCAFFVLLGGFVYFVNPLLRLVKEFIDLLRGESFNFLRKRFGVSAKRFLRELVAFCYSGADLATISAKFAPVLASCAA
jgi:hypothetical protein